MSTAKINFKKSQFNQPWAETGTYDVTIAEVNAGRRKNDAGELVPLTDQSGNQIWFVNFNLKNHRGRAIQNSWSESDKTVMAFAIFTSRALDACAIDWTEEELSTDFKGLIDLWTSKGLVGKEVKIKVTKELGTDQSKEFTKVEFL